jgi:hypothetical protein
MRVTDDLYSCLGASETVEAALPPAAVHVPVPMKQPLPNTYWVLPGRVLAGEHPYGNDDADTVRRLDQLRVAGINYFIDLTEEDEMPNYHKLLPQQSHYLRSPIRDTEVPAEVVQMQELQSRIRTALTLDRHIYIHCRAGIGRTGLVIGCYLAEEGLDGPSALIELNRLWRQSERAKSWPVVPQTDEQADYIRGWPAHRRPPKRAPMPPRLRTR